MGPNLRMCAAAVFFITAVLSTASAQTKSSKEKSLAVESDAVIVSGCLMKGAEENFIITKAHKQAGKSDEGASITTWSVDASPLAAEVLDLKNRVGQRIEAKGSVGKASAANKASDKNSYPVLVIQSLKPVAGAQPCS